MGGCGGYFAFWHVLLGSNYRCSFHGHFDDYDLMRIKDWQWRIDTPANWKNTEMHPLHNFTDISDFDYVMSLNVRSVINLTKSVVKKMLENDVKGSIINVSSQMGHVGGPNRTTYCSSKFAIEGFTKSLAIELAPDGIRVNTICPTFIQTPMTEPFLKDEDFKKNTIGMIPLGRLGEVRDLMGPFVFLASEASSLMTGSSLLVDGGWTAR